MIESLKTGLDAFFAFVPQLIGAIVILIVGYVVAKILQAVVARVLKAVGFDGWMERGGIKQFFDRAQTRETPATVLGKLVFWFVFVIAITMAADALGISQVSQVLAQSSYSSSPPSWPTSSPGWCGGPRAAMSWPASPATRSSCMRRSPR